MTPVVASPYLPADSEWDTDNVLRIHGCEARAGECEPETDDADGEARRDPFRWDLSDEGNQGKSFGTNAAGRSLEHLLTIARRGKHRGSSGGEERARKIVRCILESAIGLDATASAGITDLIALIQSLPMSGRDAVREAIR